MLPLVHSDFVASHQIAAACDVTSHVTRHHVAVSVSASRDRSAEASAPSPAVDNTPTVNGGAHRVQRRQRSSQPAVADNGSRIANGSTACGDNKETNYKVVLFL